MSMQEAKHEGDANYWKTRYVLLEAKTRGTQIQRDDLLEALQEAYKFIRPDDCELTKQKVWDAICKATAA